MAIFENGWKGNILNGLAIGIGAALLTPIVIPIVASVVKPLLKAAVKGGIILYEKGRETASEVVEVVEDIVAEAKAEMVQASKETYSGSSGSETDA